MTITQQLKPSAFDEYLDALKKRRIEIQSQRHAFDLGKQMRRDEITRCVREGWPSQNVSSQEQAKPVNNLHPNGGGTNIQKLCSYTNQPPGNMQFWGVANITTGWE